MEVYVLFHCNEWKSRDSYRLIGVVSKPNLKKALNKIKEECDYDDKELETYIAVTKCNMDNLEKI